MWKFNTTSIAHLLTAFCLIFVSANLKAQSSDSIPQIRLEIDTTEALIGDHKEVNLQLEAYKTFAIQWPNINNWSPKVRLVEPAIPDTIAEGIKNTYELNFKIISFDTGYIALPPLQFVYSDGTDIDTIESEPILFHIKSLPVDTTKAIKPIKPVESEPYTLKEFLPHILIGSGSIAVLLILAYVFYRVYNKKPIIPTRSKPTDPAHIEAYKSLKKLENKKLWQSGLIKEYYTDLTNILRRYISRQFEIHAMEETSSEILNDLNSLSIDKTLISKIKDLLETSDFVKFAKLTPANEKFSVHLKTVSSFVDETKPQEVEPDKKTEK